MMLINELPPYIDGNGLVSNAVVPGGVKRASDNGVLFTSQSLILAPYGHNLLHLVLALKHCIDKDGYLHRAPGDETEDAPDDHYGILAAACYFGCTPELIPKLPLRCMHPLLIYTRYIAKGNPLARLFSILLSLIVAFSNINEEKSNTSNKLLTWTIIKGLEQRSLAFKLAGMFWTYRMKKIYGSTKEIAKIYFGESHPFVKYWKE